MPRGHGSRAFSFKTIRKRYQRASIRPMAGYRFKKTAVGGTFDRFHKGHEALLTTAFSLSSSVFIGVTTKNLHQEKILSKLIEPYDIRVRNVQAFLTKNGYLERAHIIPLDH